MPLTRDAIFDRITVDYAVRGAARVTWLLKPRFTDEQPYTFQMQASRTGGEDWVNVGAAVVNEYFAIDDEQRLYGQDMRLTYRVQLTTPVGDYVSGPATPLAKLSRRMWLQAREIIRQLTLNQRGLESFAGFLLKRRIQGTKCTRCVNRLTGGTQDPDCQVCRGTGLLDGYFRAIGAKCYDFTPDQKRTHHQGNQGTITQPISFPAFFVGIPLISNRDVWIDANSDRRYFIDDVKNISELNRLPLACTCAMNPIEFSDIIYSVPREGM